MYLSEDFARKILNLNPQPERGIIDPQIAERQFQVILSGFNHLIQPDNNFLYVADEVGLGKTYIAIGIASLLRYFSDHVESYNDVIVVPKQNLQYKWQKEISNFIQNNYLLNDNIVKSVLNKPVANNSKEVLQHHLCGFKSDDPKYVIYRMSSFSLGSDNDEESVRWMEILRGNLPEFQHNLFDRVCKRFKRDHDIIKHAYAYLLNQSIPEIDFLIVDEAHNFKHGIEGQVSIRNQVVSRFFGANMDDNDLFEAFPEIKECIRPKIKKLLFLSATPINTQLIEIKRQLDCFLMDHSFKNSGDEAVTEALINTQLSNFFIRGLMTIKLNENTFSRNTYRHEHRYGNVTMLENANPQYLKDNKTALVLSLMQYKTIKELNESNNNIFEMGMLAGFESFDSKKTTEFERDSVEHQKDNRAKDEGVIKMVVDSYYNTFKEYPPHPKQDALVDEVFQLMLNREKSLIFVRRIASVRELEKKFLKKYSDYLVGLIRKVKNYNEFPQLKKLVETYEHETDREEYERIFILLADRMPSSLKKDLIFSLDGEVEPQMEIASEIREVFDSSVNNMDITRFQELIKNHVGRKNVTQNLKDITQELLRLKLQNTLILNDADEDEDAPLDDDENTEEKSTYFFQRYFYNEGKKFKKKSYTKDWLSINLLLFNDKFDLFRINNQMLTIELDLTEFKIDIRKFTAQYELVKNAIRSKERSDIQIHDTFRVNTFITELLLKILDVEFSNWVQEHRHLIKEDNYTRFIDELETLNELLRSIFRQGSGLIPTFIADSLTHSKADQRADFIIEMKRLLMGDFIFILDEIKDILKDYDKIVDKNFDDKNRIRYNLIQQLPITGVSGHHKRDVRKTAIQFRMPGYPYVLIATDILKEGEDLHSYCKNIYHYGIAWNPSDMEQRTGRIDRVDSLAYRTIKKSEVATDETISFQNKLQVFYPYLADTLEVNQMCKLFAGMEKFTDIFYNDLSVRMEKESKVQIDDIVDSIIPQRVGLLQSKYDIGNFNDVSDGDTPLELKDQLGYRYDELFDRLTSVYEMLIKDTFYVAPEMDKRFLRINGVCKIRKDRQGPFILSIKQKNKPGQFEFVIESCLGRASTFNSHSVRPKVELMLKKFSDRYKRQIQPIEKNSMLWIFVSTDLEEDSHITYDNLMKFIHLTDKMEAAFSKNDDASNVFE